MKDENKTGNDSASSFSPHPSSFAAPGFWRNLWTQTIAEPLARIDRDTRAFLASPASRRMDWKLAIVIVTSAVCLCCDSYPIITWTWVRFLDFLNWLGLESFVALHSVLYHPKNDQLNSRTNWVLNCLAYYFVLPAIVIRFVLREPLRNYGLKLRGAFTDWWLYVVMLGIMVPIVLVASTQKQFLDTYPFYRLTPDEPLRPNFWRWEAMYALQFFGVEFFFRGFMVHGLKHRFGVYAIFPMVVPYCMIHFGKPLPETLASIVAGVALGFMSLKTRSIWLGTAIHISVALGMDMAALWRKGMFM